MTSQLQDSLRELPSSQRRAFYSAQSGEPEAEAFVNKCSITGWATFKFFLPGRRVREVTVGPRGGIRSDCTWRT